MNLESKKADRITSILIGVVAFILYLVPFIIENSTTFQGIYEQIPTSWGGLGLVLIGIFVLSLAYYNFITSEVRAKESKKEGFDKGVDVCCDAIDDPELHKKTLFPEDEGA